MLEIVMNYQALLENLGTFIDESKYKKEHFFSELNVSRGTFYYKLKNKSFTVAEMLKLGYILFPEEAKALEIKEALELSRKDSSEGRIRPHGEVMRSLRKRANQ